MTHFSRSKRFIFIPLMVLVVLFLVSGLVMLLWNNILPDVFNIRAITYWQAMGILILCKILFGGKPGRPGWGQHRMWEKKLREKFANMTPEERKNFKDEFKRRATEWHHNPHGSERPPYGRDMPNHPFDPWNQPDENEQQPGPQNDK